jgi:hypothetical protein
MASNETPELSAAYAANGQSNAASTYFRTSQNAHGEFTVG